MGNVVRLDFEARQRTPQAPAPASPAPLNGGLILLWRAPGAAEGHLRQRGHGAMCGVAGPLVLAEPGTLPCRACFHGSHP